MNSAFYRFFLIINRKNYLPIDGKALPVSLTNKGKTLMAHADSIL
jgi:hypothetical protein